jgi:hypothetical protein
MRSFERMLPAPLLACALCALFTSLQWPFYCTLVTTAIGIIFLSHWLSASSTSEGRAVDVTCQKLDGHEVIITLKPGAMTVADVKIGIERLDGMQCKRQQLYALDGECPLDDSTRLCQPCTLALLVIDTAVSWANASHLVSLSDNGKIATRKPGDDFQYKLVTGSEIASSAGEYYWEIELLKYKGGMFVGVARPSLDHEEDHVVGGIGGFTDDGFTEGGYTHAYFMSVRDGSLHGGGKDGTDASGRLAPALSHSTHSHYSL